MGFGKNNNERRFELINILCLSIGITVSGLLFFWVVNEFSFDKFHADGDNIYRLYSTEKTMGVKQPNSVCRLYKDLPDKIPQIADGLVISVHKNDGEGTFVIQKDGNEEGHFVTSIVSTSNFFSFFSYPVIEGMSGTQLLPGQVAISKDVAHKLFGRESAIGKTVEVFYMGEKTLSEIVLVVDVPANTHLPFDIVVPYSTKSQLLLDNPNYMGCVYVKTYSHATFSTAEAKRISNIQKTDYGKNYLLGFQPLYKIHLHTDFDDAYSSNNGKASYVWIIIVGMVLILIVTVINCATLDISRIIKQAKNMAVKKVFGGNDINILSESFKNSFLNTLIAIVLSLILIWAILPKFQSLMQEKINIEIGWPIILFAVGLAIVLPLTTVMFQYYCLRSVRFSDILKGRMRFQKGIQFSNGISVFQVATSAMMAVFTFTILFQINHMQNYEDGIDTSNLISINSRNITSYDVPVIREELLKNPNVIGVGLCTGNVKNLNEAISNVIWDGKEMDAEIPFNIWITDAYFMKMIGLKLVEGRFLDENLNADDYFDGKYIGNQEYVINETAVSAMGITPQEAIGKRISAGGIGKGVIVGVVKDFNFRDLHNSISPMVICYYPESLPNVMVKILPEDKEQTLEFIKETIRSFLYTSIFDFQFVDDLNVYGQENRLGTLSAIFFIAALLLAFFGFAAIISYHINQESSNIAIHKVFGATLGQIGLQYIVKRLRLYMLPLVIALCVSCYISSRWIDNFASRINSNVVILIAILVLVFVLLLLGIIVLINVSIIGRKKIVDVIQK